MSSSKEIIPSEMETLKAGAWASIGASMGTDGRAIAESGASTLGQIRGATPPK